MYSKILSKIKEDLKAVMLKEMSDRKNDSEIDSTHKTVCRAIISMYPEIGVKPDKATDEDTIKLLKRYISMEKTRELYIQHHITESDIKGLNASQVDVLIKSKIDELGDNLTSPKIMIAKEYLPAQASEEEIKQWITENIDFSKYKNKIQAMSPLMKKFSGCDGNYIRQILLKINI
jgi:uncharacterized protein